MSVKCSVKKFTHENLGYKLIHGIFTKNLSRVNIHG